MKPLRFCMVTTFYPPYNFGGDGWFVYNLANALAKNGHQVDVVHCADSYRVHAGEPKDVVPHRNDIKVHTLRSPFGLISPLATQLTGRSFFKTQALARVLDAGFDVIHYHNASLIGADALALGKGVKLYTPHEYWLVCPTHTLFKLDREPCESRQCTLCSLAYRRPPQLWRKFGLLESATKNINAFLFPSRSSIELHRRAGFNGPSILLPEFAPATHDKAETSGEQPRQPYFLFVGRLENLKGLQTLIPVFRRVSNADLLIAGDGGMAAELARLADGAANIKFLGQVSADRLIALYRGAVAVIVPSLAYESFSLVTVESFREGTPVLARNLGGPKELLEESGGGILFNSAGEAESSIRELLDNPRLRNDLGSRGKEAYRQKWSEPAHLERYLSIIDGLR